MAWANELGGLTVVARDSFFGVFSLELNFMNIDEKTISFNDKLSRNLQGEEVYLEINQRTAARTECQTRITVGGGSRT